MDSKKKTNMRERINRLFVNILISVWLFIGVFGVFVFILYLNGQSVAALPKWFGPVVGAICGFSVSIVRPVKK